MPKVHQRKMLNYFCDVFLICSINILGAFCMHGFVSIYRKKAQGNTPRSDYGYLWVAVQ